MARIRSLCPYMPLMVLSFSFYCYHPLVEALTKVTTRQNRTFLDFITTIVGLITGISEKAGQVGRCYPSAQSAVYVKGALRGDLVAECT